MWCWCAAARRELALLLEHVGESVVGEFFGDFEHALLARYLGFALVEGGRVRK